MSFYSFNSWLRICISHSYPSSVEYICVLIYLHLFGRNLIIYFFELKLERNSTPHHPRKALEQITFINAILWPNALYITLSCNKNCSYVNNIFVIIFNMLPLISTHTIYYILPSSIEQMDKTNTIYFGNRKIKS
jgi:hypothetical protein